MKFFFGVVLIVIFLVPFNAISEIKSRTDNEGNLIYYNINPAKKKSVKNMTLPVKDDKRYSIEKINEIIEEACMANKMEPKLIKSIVKIESDFNTRAISSAGAVGLMQLMPETAEYYDVIDLTNPVENVNAGVKHFAYLMEYFKGDVPLSLAAYHSGFSRVYKTKKIPPIKATIDYVNTVMKLYNGTSGYEEKSRRIYRIMSADGTIEFRN